MAACLRSRSSTVSTQDQLHCSDEADTNAPDGITLLSSGRSDTKSRASPFVSLKPVQGAQMALVAGMNGSTGRLWLWNAVSLSCRTPLYACDVGAGMVAGIGHKCVEVLWAAVDPAEAPPVPDSARICTPIFVAMALCGAARGGCLRSTAMTCEMAALLPNGSWHMLRTVHPATCSPHATSAAADRSLGRPVRTTIAYCPSTYCAVMVLDGGQLCIWDFVRDAPRCVIANAAHDICAVAVAVHAPALPPRNAADARAAATPATASVATTTAAAGVGSMLVAFGTESGCVHVYGPALADG